MTENKQFTTRNIINSSYCVWDNNGKEYGNDEVVELLNELHNKYIDEYTFRETLQLELQRVEEENKELKKQVNDLQFNKSIGQREYQRRLSE